MSNNTPTNNNDSSENKAGCIVQLILIIVIIGFVIYVINSCNSCFSSLTSSDTSSYKRYAVGSQVKLPYLILGVTESDWDQLVQYATRKQHTEMLAMAARGRAFIVEDDTSAEVVGTSSLYMIRVKILDGAHAGRTGWLSSELL